MEHRLFYESKFSDTFDILLRGISKRHTSEQYAFTLLV